MEPGGVDHVGGVWTRIMREEHHADVVVATRADGSLGQIARERIVHGQLHVALQRKLHNKLLFSLYYTSISIDMHKSR